jgi:DNA-binding response OmpR family regulator
MSTSARKPKVTAVTETVLVVEDDVLVRITICEYLRHCGYRVIEAVNADEAMTLLREPTVAIDTVLAAVKIPGAMDGFALGQWIRQNRPNVDLILAGNVVRAADAAANLCETGPTLSRPYDPQMVVERIRRLRALRNRRKST